LNHRGTGGDFDRTSTASEVMGYVVAQLGARMHYAVPRILYESGQLEHFYTDICASKGWPRWFTSVPAAWRPDGLHRLVGRVPQNVPPEKITAFNLLGLRYARRRRRARSSGDLRRNFLWMGKTFCQHILARGLGAGRGVYVFNSAGLEVLDAAKRSMRRTVLEQTIAPLQVESDLLRCEQECFPNWQDPIGEDSALARLCERERAEWQLADKILCGSGFVRDGIAACGGPAERCVIVPYGVDGRFRLPPRRPHGGPIRVLVVGAVGLRKGSPYVLAAAGSLRFRAIFRMVGPAECLEPAIRALRDTVELTGPVPHSVMLEHFAWADLLLLPSLCEGSATVIYEALAASLPVICTPNCGSIVRDGVDGIVIPIRDSEAIVEAVLDLARNPERRRVMAENAEKRAAMFDFGAYRRALATALSLEPAQVRP
jgi:glycosyltransferase involved in cell wall biosynthesis